MQQEVAMAGASRGSLEVYVWAEIALLAECQLINLIKKRTVTWAREWEMHVTILFSPRGQTSSGAKV